MRRVLQNASCQNATVRRSVICQARHYAQKDLGPDKTHLHDKHSADSNLNVQSKSAAQAHEQRAEGKSDSQAISQKDERNSAEQAAKDHPAARHPIIGMNDERGRKGY